MAQITGGAVREDRGQKKMRDQCRQEDSSNKEVSENIHVGMETRKDRWEQTQEQSNAHSAMD